MVYFLCGFAAVSTKLPHMISKFKMEENDAREFERAKCPSSLIRLLLQHRFFVDLERYTFEHGYYRGEPFDLSELQFWIEAELGKHLEELFVMLVFDFCDAGFELLSLSLTDDHSSIAVWEHELVQEFPALKHLLEKYRQHKNVYHHLALFPETNETLPVLQGSLFHDTTRLIVSCMTLYQLKSMKEELSTDPSFVPSMKLEERGALLLYEKLKRFRNDHG